MSPMRLGRARSASEVVGAHARAPDGHYPDVVPDRKLAIYLELERELARPNPILDRAEMLARKARRQHERQKEIWRFQHEPGLLFTVPPGERGTKLHRWLTVSIVLNALILWMTSGILGLLIGIVIGILVLVGWNARINEREKEAGNRPSRCHCCRYDLAGLDSNSALDRLDVELGVRTCPECGIDWPQAPELRFDPWDSSPTEGIWV